MVAIFAGKVMAEQVEMRRKQEREGEQKM